MVPPNHILEAKKKELMKLQAAGDAIKAELVTEEKKTADLAADAKKRKAGEEKRHVNMVHIAISCPEGLVARCRIPTAAVIQLGLFRLLGGDKIDVSNVVDKISIEPNSTQTLSKKADMTAQDANWADAYCSTAQGMADPFCYKYGSEDS